jgi:hypothetical protein
MSKDQAFVSVIVQNVRVEMANLTLGHEFESCHAINTTVFYTLLTYAMHTQVSYIKYREYLVY